MKSILSIILIFGITFFINSQELKSMNDYNGYIPTILKGVDSEGNFTDEFGRNIIIDSLKLDSFNNISTTVTILDDKENIGGFGVTYEKGIYKIVYSFEIFIKAYDDSSKLYHIGAAIDVVANVKTRKNKLDLSSLFNLAISAEKNKVRGSLSIAAKGFNSNNIYNLFNINASIDRASVQQVLKNVGIMISKFSDKTISLKPVILGSQSNTN